MRNLSPAIIGLTVLLISIFSKGTVGENIQTEPSKSPHGVDFKTTCTTCHSTKGWIVDKEKFTFNHDKTRMPLVGQHAKTNCKLCHPTLVFSEAKTECLQCHSDIHESTVGKECSRCHTPHSWLVKNISLIHQQSRFPLLGVHATIDCYQCHKSETLERFDLISTECFSCHSNDYAATTQPNHTIAGYSTNCTDCHTIFSKEWKGIGFNHNFFPLTQGHNINDCLKCHINGNYSNTSGDCISCHLPDYNSTANPNHKLAGYSTNCTMCHTTVPGWKPATFDHSKFPLTQGHLINDCSKCHVNGLYSNTSNQCISCHQEDYNTTTNPNHLSANFSTNCTMCHSTAPGWKPTTYNHNQFPLTQGHNIKDCSKCHMDGNYSNTSSNCISCHQTDYNATTNPNHTLAGYSTNCMICHTTVPGWKPATFDHSRFPLTQGHNITDCSKCHINGNYSNTSGDCISCHQPDYNATTNPNHLSANFSTNCTMCHSTAPGWKPTTYNHSQFPLTQGHNITDCSKCHINGNYSNTSSNCISCHQPDYNATTNPNHLSANFSTNCTTCHSTAPGWKPTTYNHSIFPLTQGHNINDCSKCHINGNYSNTSSNCISCHQSDYNATSNPNHLSANFSTNCTTCHSTAPGWKPTTYNHSIFPLTQGHNINNCSKCHLNGNYSNTSNQCVSCHQADYNSTTNPNHATTGYSTNCVTCHTTAPGWKPATFDHSKFPLTQGHNISDCSRCHINGDYSNTSNQCVSCHQSDYNATTNPSHTSLNFSTTCTACHTTAPGWKPASYTQHDAQSFPIYSGRHKGQWNSCTDCHANTSNYSVFSCINCHEHNKTDMDSAHRGRNGYQYNSVSCFNCHPRGVAD